MFRPMFMVRPVIMFGQLFVLGHFLCLPMPLFMYGPLGINILSHRY